MAESMLHTHKAMLKVAALVVFSLLISSVNGRPLSDDDVRDVADPLEPRVNLDEEPSTGDLDGDIKLTPEQEHLLQENQQETRRVKRKAVTDWRKLWPNGTIPYKIEESARNFSAAISLAIEHWESNTCLTFDPSPTTEQYLSFQLSNKPTICWSYVGKVTILPQPIGIAPKCATFGTIVHEIGHAIGFNHEQSRPDRDDWIVVHEENIITGEMKNFILNSFDQTMTSIPYDYESIMHYSPYSYAIDRTIPTITTKNPFNFPYIGQRKALSFRDVQAANMIYNCSVGCPSLTCYNEGFVGPDCTCVCPEKFTGTHCQDDNPNYVQPCEFEMTSNSGMIQSPNFGIGNYPLDTICIYHIKPSVNLPNMTITLTFDSFSLENSNECIWDYVRVFNDTFTYQGPKFCGSTLPAPITTIGSEMIVWFRSDIYQTMPGFRANYTIELEPSSTNVPVTTLPTSTLIPESTAITVPVTTSEHLTEPASTTTSRATTSVRPTDQSPTTARMTTSERPTEPASTTIYAVATSKLTTESASTTTSRVTTSERPTEPAPPATSRATSVRPTEPVSTTVLVTTSERSTEPASTTSRVTSERPTEPASSTTARVTTSERPTEPATTTSRVTTSERPTEPATTTARVTTSERPTEPATTTARVITSERPTEPATTARITTSERPTEPATTTSLVITSERSTEPATTTARVTTSERPTEAATTTSRITTSERPTEPATTTARITTSERPTEPATTTARVITSERPTEPATTARITTSERPTEPATTTSLVITSERPTEPATTTARVTTSERPTEPATTTSRITTSKRPTEPATTARITTSERPTEPATTTSRITTSERPTEPATTTSRVTTSERTTEPVSTTTARATTQRPTSPVVSTTASVSSTPPTEPSVSQLISTASMSQNECSATYTGLSGDLNSPNYPRKYPNNKKCSYTINVPVGKRIVLQFKDFQIENEGDFSNLQSSCPFDAILVHLGNGIRMPMKLCGNKQPEEALVSLANTMTLELITDSTIRKKGFSASYHTIYEPLPSLGEEHVITSPKWPEQCPGMLRDTYSLEVEENFRVELTFNVIDLIDDVTCREDELEIDLGRGIAVPMILCGNRLPEGSLVSLDNTMNLKLLTDRSSTRRGFSASYRAVPADIFDLPDNDDEVEEDLDGSENRNGNSNGNGYGTGNHGNGNGNGNRNRNGNMNENGRGNGNSLGNGNGNWNWNQYHDYWNGDDYVNGNLVDHWDGEGNGNGAWDGDRFENDHWNGDMNENGNGYWNDYRNNNGYDNGRGWQWE
ncbi:uncharacterized protein LOC129265532 isoform X2 [Lytechinus pictus]|uniref:uncharacterized protein LOC129265532 isoform X2 n=1 Tax=Lytechinus pictus TaxID=7653 RepID=UPI0030B9FF32